MEYCTVCFNLPIDYLLTVASGEYELDGKVERCSLPVHYLVCSACVTMLGKGDKLVELTDIISKRSPNMTYFPTSLIPLLTSKKFDCHHVWSPNEPPFRRHHLLTIVGAQQSEGGPVEEEDDHLPF